MLHEAWQAIFDGGMDQLLADFGHRLHEAAQAAALVGAPDYETLFREVAEARDDAGRLEALEDRYWEREDEIGSPLDCALRYAQEHPDEFFLSEREAAQDVDAFLARLVARAGPVECAGADELEVVEAELGRPLPPLLRRLYADVGAHGWGPGRGFLAPAELMDIWQHATAAFRGPGPDDVWPDALLPIARAHDGAVFWVDAAEPRLRVVRVPATGPTGWIMGRPTQPFVTTSLRGWLEAWLRAPA